MNEYTAQSYINKSVQELEAFLSNDKFKSVKHSPYMNVTDQVRGGVYYIPFNLQKVREIKTAAEPVGPSPQDDSDSASEEVETETETKMVVYKKDVSDLDTFFDLLEKARLRDAILNYSERQYFTIPNSKNVPYLKLENKDTVVPIEDDDADIEDYNEVNDVDIEINTSCIMIDFDIYQPGKTSQITEQICYDLVTHFTNKIYELFDLSPIINLPEEKSHIYFAFTKRQMVSDVKHKTYGDCYKDGLHILIFVKTTKAAKSFLIKHMVTSGSISDIFKMWKICGDAADMIDRASAWVPNLFYGCAKREKQPYKLAYVYRAVVKRMNVMKNLRIYPCNELFPTQIDVVNPRARTKAKQVETAYKYKYNLCYELSLHYHSPQQLIDKHEITLRIEYYEEARVHNERTEDNLNSQNELQEIEYSISDLSLRYSNVKFLQKVLMLLKPSRVAEFDDWKKVIIILARENPDYKPLAIWFSQRYAKSWVKGGLTTLNGLWDWTMANPIKDDEKYSRLGTLYSWAKQDNPEGYERAQINNTASIINKYAFEDQGKLSDIHIAEILHLMYRFKYKYDVNEHAASKTQAGCWYEFVLPSDDVGLDKGTIYKYRYEMRPDTLELALSRALPVHIRNVLDFIEKQEPSAEDETAQKRLAKIKAGLLNTITRLGSTAIVSGVIGKCEKIFRVRGFIRQLDKNENVIGVGNGVLQLYPRVELIQRYHEIPIVRYTPVDFREYDVNNPYIKELETAIRDLFAGEEDAFYFTMCYLASSMDGRNKIPLLFLWMGEGSNGKSFLLEMHINMLGQVVNGGYGTKMSIAFLTKDRKDGPDSEKMLLKHARFAYFSESDPGEYIKTGNVKEITGGENISAAEKFQKQDNFRVHCHFVVASNNDPRITGSDHGTWRRILVYRFKMKLCNNPDPNNPYEKQVDSKFSDSVNRNPEYLSAYMSIMSKYYKLYIEKHQGDLSKIPKPSIDRDTKAYRNEQDTINRFINDRVVHIGPLNEEGEPTDHISLEDVANAYIIWYRSSIADIKLTTMDIVKMFAKSSLQKYIQKLSTGDFLTHHKILAKNETAAQSPLRGSSPKKATVPLENNLDSIPEDNQDADLVLEDNLVDNLVDDLDGLDDEPADEPAEEIVDDLDDEPKDEIVDDLDDEPKEEIVDDLE